jgi:hypothetical protein
MSRTFSTNSGSEDSLKVSLRCGFSPKARQTRPTVVAERHAALAIERRLQWVAPAGIVSRVRVTSAATASSPIRRGAPLLGSSDSPASRSLAKRSRHLPAVWAQAPASAATAWLVRPAAQRRTMRARSASPCGAFRRRDKPSSSARSGALRTIGVARP